MDESTGDRYAYVDGGGTAPRPADPSLVTTEGVAHSFVGWTAVAPEGWTFVNGNNTVDLAAFNASYRFDFDTPIDGPTTLVRRVGPRCDHGDAPKDRPGRCTAPAGAEFTLRRIQTEVMAGDGGYIFVPPVVDGEGNYPMDPNFPTRAVSTGEGGGGVFADLPAGYYLLTESQAPEGYNGIPQSVVLFLPYGDGEPGLYGSPTAQVNGAADEAGNLTVTVANTLRVQRYHHRAGQPHPLLYASGT